MRTRAERERLKRDLGTANVMATAAEQRATFSAIEEAARKAAAAAAAAARAQQLQDRIASIETQRQR